MLKSGALTPLFEFIDIVYKIVKNVDFFAVNMV